MIALAKDGVLFPNEAEAFAKIRGLSSFATTAAPDAFNPLEEPTWSLAMTVAWIV